MTFMMIMYNFDSIKELVQVCIYITQKLQNYIPDIHVIYEFLKGIQFNSLDYTEDILEIDPSEQESEACQFHRLIKNAH